MEKPIRRFYFRVAMHYFGHMAENIHDKFFKENFSRQDVAADFVRQTFPGKLLQNLNLDTFTLTNSSYVDSRLEEYFADIVYTCQYQGEKQIEVAILFEHKSYREKHPHFQLLRYLLNRWEEARKQDQSPALIIPIIIYHGKARWHYEPLPAYFGSVDTVLTRFLPTFDYLLCDISRYSDEEILNFQNKFLATSFFLMKHRDNERRLLAQKRRLFVWLDDITHSEAGMSYLQASIVYLLKTAELRDRNFFSELLSTSRNMTAYDKLMESTTEQTIIALLKNAHQQGIDITKLANQDYGLSKERILIIVDNIRKGLL